MERYAYVLLFFFSSCSILSLAIAEDQSATMLSLSRLVGRSWNTTNPNPCLWPGVACSPSSLVTTLSLPDLPVTPNATFFYLLNKLNSLQVLNLSSNRLSGPLPDFSSLPSLQVLDLSHNHFQGPVQSQLSALAALKSLNLSSNLLTGPLPAANISSGISELVLSQNSFDGPIPDDLFQFNNLTVLDLSDNSLSGSLSNSTRTLSKLQSLLLSDNLLTGEIPGALSEIATLSRFAAHQNLFSGAIPAGITNHLQVLDLSYNQLSGVISPDFLERDGLQSVDLTSNRLQGRIPEKLSNTLFQLRLGGNSLNGSIPAAIGSASSLTYLVLDGNRLEAVIPPQIGGCKNLTLLNLASNKLQGALPVELGTLQKLVVLRLQMNKFTGEIPAELFRLKQLNTLNLSRNTFTGEIPPAISGLSKLSTLNLEGNRFTGSLPASIGDMDSLLELEVGNNELTGTVPVMPVSLTTALNLSGNQLTGIIPSYLSKLTSLEILDLSNNEFSGPVPDSLTRMQSLTQLVLSNNRLSGVLPHFQNFVNVTVTGNTDLVNGTETAIPATPPKRKSNTLLIIVVVIVSACVGSGLVVLILLLFVFKRFYRVEDVAPQSDENPPLIINGCFLTTNSIHKSSINFAKAMEAVANPNNVMLKTRFSTYYKAAMPSGVSYSVKKLNWSDKIFQTGSHGRFAHELEVLGKLSTSNVMVPLAYVLSEDNAYLFYEHLEKGTVFDFLHKGTEGDHDWASRYSIALGVAQGLTFLHCCSQPIVLLDLTTKSVHLKSAKEPQIGDVELCKVIDPSKSTGSLSTVAGSVGYIPPEYAYTMRVTMAGNVYSFGVILLELLTGKPPVSEGIELAKWAMGRSSRPAERERILDPRISKESHAVRSQMLSVLKVALECVNFSPEARPKMQKAYRMLFNAR